jgi:putative transferase (TIGR04331 family)
MISQHIPTFYLEGYNSLVDCIENVAWPAKPKCIFTSNALHSNDVFKAWAAQQTENGASFIIGQHGGHYGIGLWIWIEEHEIAISDRYLSWGWNEPEQPKVHPVGQIKQRVPLGVNHAEQSGLLLVTTTMPRYSYHMYSSFVSSQWLDYLEDQFMFTENLSPIIQNTLTVRLYAQDYRWDQEKRWSDRFPNVALDSGKKNIDELIARSRVFVSTYNAATYLESFTMNIPTVIFWNPKHWELRDTAVSYFEELKRVGIFHDTPEAAACHVKDVWDDINSWWDDRLVKKALRRFKERYCNQQTDLLTSVEAELREEVISHSHTNNL